MMIDALLDTVERWFAQRLSTRPPPRICKFCGGRTAELSAVFGREQDRDLQERWVCRRCHGVETSGMEEASAPAGELNPGSVPRL
jgi:hypothetical protein